MILKGSQRANGADLAIHLMNGFDNESVQIAEVYGTVAGDLAGAFAEFEAVAVGTKAEQYLYSLSINPPAPLSREQYFEAIQTIEHRLGLTDQPRAVVFHVKDGREHCHVVWSRIDIEAMKAIPMSHDRRKLMDIACELAEKYDLALPPGLQAWKEKQYGPREKLDPSLAEKAQQDEHGITPEQRREEITACYEQADAPAAFISALEQKGYVLAAGDRRGFVIVDRFANVHSLSRYVNGHKASAIKARLAPLTLEQLPSVDQAKEIMRQRNLAREESEGESARQEKRHDEERKSAQEALARQHEKRRAELRSSEQELLTRQQAEQLSLHAAQASESRGLIFRVRSVVADLIGKTPALRSVIGPLQKLTHLDPKERHVLERDALTRRHARERQDIERQKRTIARVETRERIALEKAMRKAAQQARKLGLSSEAERARIEGKARHEFYEAARDRVVRSSGGADEIELTVNFNDAAEFVEGAGESGEDDDRARTWKQRAEERRSLKPKRGKGYGYRRDSE